MLSDLVDFRRKRSIVDWDRRANNDHKLSKVSYDVVVSELPTSYRVKSAPKKKSKKEKSTISTVDKWQQVTTFKDREKRSSEDSTSAGEMGAFASWLLEIGEGRHQRCPDRSVDPSYAMLPVDMVLDEPPQGSSGASQLVDHIYGDIEQRYQDPAYFAERAILAPWNADVDALNNMVLDKIPVGSPSDEHEYLSLDDVVDREDFEEELYPAEFLNSLSFSGLPAHKLRLRVGAIVMLLRNLNGQQGLCNGTRLQVCRMMHNCIDAMILNGSHMGNRVILPKLELSSSDSTLPFQIKRTQLPVKIAFAMTVHKAQGQTIYKLGLFLPRPVFGHGQLYVALSRVTSKANVKAVVENAVYEDDEGTSRKLPVFGTYLDP